ncbi:MAG TPA: xylulokinase [Pyrinomonadaceae bacterium]|nr:xylulokinase [Pyrinomonadaceae bacterium]
MTTKLLGIDVSTTGVKALVIDRDGAISDSFTSPLHLSNPQPLWSEQKPNDWWQAAVNSIQHVVRENAGGDIAAIGLTGQMHGLVLLDEAGEVLRPSILWNDQRCAAECDEIRARLGKERLIQISGNDALTGFTAPKIVWVRNHEREVYDRARHVLLPKDYLRYKLTSEYAMDKADGSGTLLFDLQRRDWSNELLDALDIPAAWLPPTFEGPAITSRITAEAAQATGLSEGTPVVAGGGDQAAQAVGVGAIRPGVVALTLGTSGVVFAATETPLIEAQGRLHAFCHAVPERWHLMGVMLSAAGSLQWYRDALYPNVSFQELVNEAAEVAPGSDGLLFLPYLCGERTPHPDPLARGSWVGLTTRHTRAHLTRAVLEGVAFGFKDMFSLMQDVGLGEIDEVRVSGGGAKSNLWRQILADVLGSELVTVNTTEGAAYGAALLAGVAAGVWPNVDRACAQTIRVSDRVTPSETNTARYAEMYRQYQSLYPALRTVSHSLSEIESSSSAKAQS